MGFENEGQILTASDSVALTPAFAPKPCLSDLGFETKMMPRNPIQIWTRNHVSDGGALICRTRMRATRLLSGLRLWARPETWEPRVFTSPVQALDWGFVQNVNLIGSV
jgi:hypothetical protein